MSLSPPAPRRHMHTRSIVCEGFEREDGLWDIEARIIDTKTYPYDEPFRGHRDAGSHVHDMAVRLTLDSGMIVRGVEVDMASTPYNACQGAAPSFQGLIGRKVGSGWRAAVSEAAGGTKGCTHVRELLYVMATVAFQAMVGWSDGDNADKRHQDSAQVQKRPHFLDGCRAWASDGEVVVTLYPQFAVRPTDRDGAA